ncbi:uncharacterized protein LOC143429878 [Xylocopa sonorina]|uniref:uncharacterized protein LOC143429878 n=1 Tax=Xylocopa sonorina TaxID=1818115 RepID=UPI00403AB6EB
MTCLCDPYYSPTPDNSMCIASAGLGCTTDATCDSMRNAICRQGVCACKDSYILDISNSSNCINRPSAVDDRCQRNDECQDALDRAMCINGRCKCISSHHFVNQTGKCVPSRVLYDMCTKDYECLSPGDGSARECRNGECVCKEGEPACNKEWLGF